MRIETEDLVEALPKHMKKRVNNIMVHELNDMMKDRDERERFRENFMSYTSVLIDGKYSVMQYVQAVMYVSYKLFGYTNLEAFKKTFPDRIRRYRSENKSIEQINSFVSAYNKSKIVTKMLKDTAIPLYILNQDAVQQAINTQLDIMKKSTNDLARVKAADSLLNHLAPPVETKIEVGVDVKTSSLIDDIHKEMEAMSLRQLETITSGAITAKELVARPIVNRVVAEADYVDIS